MPININDELFRQAEFLANHEGCTIETTIETLLNEAISARLKRTRPAAQWPPSVETRIGEPS